MGAGVAKNFFLAEAQNGIHDVYVTRALSIFSHDLYMRPVGLKWLMS